MHTASPRVYRSFEEFEREELHILSSLHCAVDDMMDDWSTIDRAWRQLAGTALRAREAEARIALHMARGELGPCDARLAVPRDQVRWRMRRLRWTVSENNIYQWAARLFSALPELEHSRSHAGLFHESHLGSGGGD